MDLFADVHEADIKYNGDYTELKTEVKPEEMINSSSLVKQSDMYISLYKSTNEKPDFVFNIVPIADNELLSENSSIEIKDESNNQVSLHKNSPILYIIKRGFKFTFMIVYYKILTP